jgi:hypothetical protein
VLENDENENDVVFVKSGGAKRSSQDAGRGGEGSHCYDISGSGAGAKISCRRPTTPEIAVELGLSLSETRALRRQDEGLCVECGARPGAGGFDTCCRGCATGAGCTCAPSQAPDSSSARAPPLTRTRSERLAVETGIDVATARALLAENDEAEQDRCSP